MREWIDSQPTATRDLMSGLLHLQRPSEIQPEIAPLLEQVLLKGLRLQIDQSNKIAVGPGFESFAEWFQTLIALSRETPIV
jgi:hypothetical protein